LGRQNTFDKACAVGIVADQIAVQPPQDSIDGLIALLPDQLVQQFHDANLVGTVTFMPMKR
jgi:hypothetical protein